MIEHFILDENHQPIEVDMLTWGRWFERIENRRVGWSQINSECVVSTVFLGLDHNFFGKGPRIMFESMVFGGPEDGYQRRYSTWDDALIGHNAIVKKLRAKQRVSS